MFSTITGFMVEGFLRKDEINEKGSSRCLTVKKEDVLHSIQ